MAARLGMTSLIQRLRSLTDAAEGQTDVNGVSYWTDDQLQDILDQHGRDVLDMPLSPVPQRVDGVRVIKRFDIPLAVGRFCEDDPTSYKVVDSLGFVLTGYTISFVNRVVMFDTDQPTTEAYLNCRSYDLNEAAAQVWLEKAGHRSALFDWKAGGQSLSEDQEYQHCLEQYRRYSGSHIKTTRLTHTGYQNG